ncbi:hypothetical protein H6G76_30575 [Nostoc sp. FACHB-152]|nr:hypothetical protein [Nostoc sp. FACHB-152]MBD2469401.1 hypothetical protein [Nostoc sp. FACHB-145]
MAPVIETLEYLLEQDQAAIFDFAFIDADKENYYSYYEVALKLVRPGGLIAIDNVLWSGRLIQPEIQDSATIAIREFNSKLAQDDRIDLSLIALADGLTLARKRN